MGFVRKMFVGLCAGLMGAALFGVAWTNIGTATIRNQKTVKNWFSKSGFYDQVADIALTNIKKASAQSGSSEIPVTDPAIQAVVKDALSPEFIKTNIDSSLDSIYSWLSGTNQDLLFKLDLNPVKDKIAAGVGNFAKTRAAGLPVCGVIGNNSPVDPFAATCLPRGVTPEQVGTLATQTFLTQDFLKNPVITSKDLKIADGSGKSIPIAEDSRAKAVQKAYHLSGFLPVALIISAVLFMTGVIFLSADRLKGISRVGLVFLVTGLSLLVLYGGTRYIFDWASKRVLATQGGPSAEVKLGVNFFKVALNDVERVLLIYAIAYIVLGIAAKVTAYLLKKRREPDTKEGDEGEPKPEEPKTVPEAPPTPVLPRRPRPPRKIQL